MAEPRDRLAKAEDIAATFARQRRLIRDNRTFVDEPDSSGGFSESPARRRQEATTPGSSTNAAFGRRRFGSPGIRRRLYGSRAFVGRENVAAGSSGGRLRRSGSVLPSWYPRTALRDITHVARAIEKRRAYIRNRECQQAESPIASVPKIDDQSASSSTAPLEHDPSLVTPMLPVATKHFAAGKIPKILLSITKQNDEELELLSPQKKLLNSIDKVEKVVMEELHRQKGTPSAVKAERHKRVRSLMSMR